MEDLVEQQLWGDAASAGAGEDGSSDGGSGSGSIGSLAAEAADDQGLDAWDINMKALKTAAYDLGRLPNEVRQTVSSELLLSQPTHNTLAQTSLLGQALKHAPRTGLARVCLLQAACSMWPPCLMHCTLNPCSALCRCASTSTVCASTISRRTGRR